MFKEKTPIIICNVIGEFKIISLEAAHPISIISNFFGEFKIMVSIRGLKKLINKVSNIANPSIPAKIKAEFFKFLKGFRVVIKPTRNSIDGIIITGPISIILLIITLVAAIF